MRIALIAAALLALTAPASDSPVAGAKQLIVVISPDWNSTTATMQRYERTRGGWRQAGASANVVIGRSGLAWGRGVNDETGEGPVKHEGDGKSPAGVFRLGTAFGFAPSASSTRLPYLPLQQSTECVDDASSKFYNRVVDRKSVPAVDWSSSEKMRSIEVYQWGAVVLHNDPPQKGAGSCIFLHLVDPHGKPTSGCTSMPAEAMSALLGWVDPKAHPLLVQLPRAEYERLRTRWQLP